MIHLHPTRGPKRRRFSRSAATASSLRHATVAAAPATPAAAPATQLAPSVRPAPASPELPEALLGHIARMGGPHIACELARAVGRQRRGFYDDPSLWRHFYRQEWGGLPALSARAAPECWRQLFAQHRSALPLRYDIEVLVDDSGSMDDAVNGSEQESAWHQAQRELHTLARQLPQFCERRTNLSLRFLHAAHHQTFWQPEDLAELRDKVPLPLGPSTPIASHLTRWLEQRAQRLLCWHGDVSAPPPAATLVILSDGGLHDASHAELRRALERLASARSPGEHHTRVQIGLLGRSHYYSGCDAWINKLRRACPTQDIFEVVPLAQLTASPSPLLALLQQRPRALRPNRLPA